MAGKLTCEQVRPLLTEIADGTLAPEKEWQAQGHIARCAECSQTLRAARSVKAMLRAAPRRQVSADFDARLAARLAAAHRPSRRAAWTEAWRSRLASLMAAPRAALRPALAAGVAGTLIAGAILGNQTWHEPDARSAASSLVTHCVAQHRSYAAAQPLADPAAQNLLAHLEPSAAGASDGVPLATDEQNL